MKKSRLLGAVSTFVYTLCVSFPINAVLLYGLSNDTSNLYKIDTTSIGNPTLVGSIGYGTDLSGLVSTVDGQLYTFDRPSDTLVSLNTSDATILDTASIDTDLAVNPRGYDVSPNGTLHVITGNTNSIELYSVSITSGLTTFITEISGVTSIEAIAFSPSGTLFAAGSSTDPFTSQSLYTLDITTGVATFVATMNVPDMDDFTYASDGFLYGVDSQDGNATDLYRIDALTGQTFNLGSAGITGFNGISTFEPQATIPIPAAVWLFASGLLGLIGITRRRANA